MSCIWRNHSIQATRGEFLWREQAAKREMWERHWLMRGVLDEGIQDFSGMRLLALATGLGAPSGEAEAPM